MNGSILVLGEALIDVVEAETTSKHVGGSPFNIARGLAALDHAVTLGGWWAKDEDGQLISDALKASGVAVLDGSDSAACTSHAYAKIDESGQARYSFEIEWDLPEAVIEAAGRSSHIHVGSIGAILQPGASKLIDALEASRDHCTLSYDPNIRGHIMGDVDEVRPAVERIISLSDLVKASDEDVTWLYGPHAVVEDVMRSWIDLGASLVVVTRGKHGSIGTIARSSETIVVPPGPANVVDTIGAGDSFMAGLVSALYEQGQLGSCSTVRPIDLAGVKSAMERGSRTADITVTRRGSYAPTRQEIGALPL